MAASAKPLSPRVRVRVRVRVKGRVRVRVRVQDRVRVGVRVRDRLRVRDRDRGRGRVRVRRPLSPRCTRPSSKPNPACCSASICFARAAAPAGTFQKRHNNVLPNSKKSCS